MLIFFGTCRLRTVHSLEVDLRRVKIKAPDLILIWRCTTKRKNHAARTLSQVEYYRILFRSAVVVKFELFVRLHGVMT